MGGPSSSSGSSSSSTNNGVSSASSVPAGNLLDHMDSLLVADENLSVDFS